MRVLIVIEDTPSGRLRTEMTCKGPANEEESPAAQLAARVATFIDDFKQNEFATQQEADEADRVIF